MSRPGCTKLVPPKPGPENNQALETIEESNVPEQKTEPVITELDDEIECPRCNDIMELRSNLDKFSLHVRELQFLVEMR
jgi:hypothetical protein